MGPNQVLTELSNAARLCICTEPGARSECSPRLKAWASLFRTQVQFRAKLGRGYPTRRGLKLLQVNVIAFQPSLYSTSSQADHMTETPGSL